MLIQTTSQHTQLNLWGIFLIAIIGGSTWSCSRQAALNRIQNLPAYDERGINAIVIWPAGTTAEQVPKSWKQLLPIELLHSWPAPANLCIVASTHQPNQAPILMWLIDEARPAGKAISAQPIAGMVFKVQNQTIRLIVATPTDAQHTLPTDWPTLQVRHPAFLDFWKSWLFMAMPLGTVSQIEWRPPEWCTNLVQRYGQTPQ